MCSHLTHRMLSMLLKSKSYKLKRSFTKIGLTPYSTNIYKGNYYLLTLPTSITKTITQTQNFPLNIFPNISPVNLRKFSFILPLFYIINRQISSLNTPKEIEQAERWLKKFTKEKIPKGKRDQF